MLTVIGRRILPLACWSYLVWILLTWTLTWEQQLVGAAVSLAVAVTFAPLGRVPGPWLVLRPRRFVALILLLIKCAGRILRANVSLMLRVCSPRLRLATGMVLVPTSANSDGYLAAVGILSSLIVDNQIVDLDRAQALLQYHAVSVPQGTGARKRAAINGPVEADLAPLFPSAAPR